MYIYNLFQDRLAKRGYEEIIGPLGPLVAQQFGPQPEPWKLGPSPEPWRVAVPQLIAAVQARDLAKRLNGQLQDATVKSATAAIDAILEDWCGTPPRRWPWPWPGPPPWSWEIASDLALVANTLQPGSLQEGLHEVAAQVIQKAAGAL